MLLEKKLSAAEFVDADVPAEVLGKFNEIVFDESSAVYKCHALTTEEVQCLCSDLKVLGRSDFKKLLKWRRSMRAHRDALAKQAAGDVVEEPEDKEPETEEQREQRETEEIEAALQRIEAKKKRAKSKVRAQKVRARVRQMGMVDVEEGANDAPSVRRRRLARYALSLTPPTGVDVLSQPDPQRRRTLGGAEGRSGRGAERQRARGRLPR